MGRRTLLLIAALVVAALGTLAVFLYAQNADQRATAGTTLVKVLVAKSNIALGTTGATASANGAFDVENVPQDNVVPGALSDVTPIATQVAVVPIFPGQQIIASQWGATASTGGLPIPTGLVAQSVQLGDPQRVAGFITPGAEIAVMATVTIPGTTTGPTTRTLLERVPVIAVGPTTVTTQTTTSTTSTTNTQQISQAILTLGVTQAQAERLAFAVQQGQLYLVLLAKDSKVAPSAGVTYKNLFK